MAKAANGAQRPEATRDLLAAVALGAIVASTVRNIVSFVRHTPRGVGVPLTVTVTVARALLLCYTAQHLAQSRSQGLPGGSANDKMRGLRCICGAAKGVGAECGAHPS